MKSGIEYLNILENKKRITYLEKIDILDDLIQTIKNKKKYDSIVIDHILLQIYPKLNYDFLRITWHSCRFLLDKKNVHLFFILKILNNPEATIWCYYRIWSIFESEFELLPLSFIIGLKSSINKNIILQAKQKEELTNFINEDLN